MHRKKKKHALKKAREMVTVSAQEINVSSTSSSRPLTADVVINLDHGDPTMYEPFWQQIGDRATVVIPGSQTMSYFSYALPLGWRRKRFQRRFIYRGCMLPHNPDGLINKVVLNSENGKTIYDLTYYWPQGDHDIMLFTVSRLLAMLALDLVKDANVPKKMTKFIEMNTIGVSKDSQLRAAKIMKVVSDGYDFPDSKPNARLFDYGRKVLAAKWEILKEVVKTKGMFSLPEYPLKTCTFYQEKTANFLLKCTKDEIEDFASYLKENKILTRSGEHFGMENKYARISMLDREETFNLLIERLVSLK